MNNAVRIPEFTFCECGNQADHVIPVVGWTRSTNILLCRRCMQDEDVVAYEIEAALDELYKKWWYFGERADKQPTRRQLKHRVDKMFPSK